MTSDQPFFRFSPHAYEEGRSLARSGETCDVCARSCGWKYTGNIYSAARPGTVCARCIADGRLGYDLHDISIEGAGPELAEEVLQRTPGVACFNPFDWPVVAGRPLAFIGYGEEKALRALPAVRAAMDDAFGTGASHYGPSPYALIFKELDDERYRVVVDLD